MGTRQIVRTRVALALHALGAVKVTKIDPVTCHATVDPPDFETKTLRQLGVDEPRIPLFRAELARLFPSIRDFIESEQDFPLTPEAVVMDIIDLSITAKLMESGPPTSCVEGGIPALP